MRKREDKGLRSEDRSWIFRSSVLRPPSSVFRSSRSGQAAIEFIVAIILFMLIVAGIVHINRMARTSLFLHAVLRGDAGKTAMESGALSVAPPYISDWEAGADGIRFTADDQPIRNSIGLSATLSTLSGYSVKSPGDWTYVTPDDRLPVSMISLQSSPIAGAVLGFVHAEETLHVPVDTVLRQLVYDKDEVAIKEEVWMPLMGGLY